jgi:hypothetical protein
MLMKVDGNDGAMTQDEERASIIVAQKCDD